MTRSDDELRALVREKYAAVAQSAAGCCGDAASAKPAGSCCGDTTGGAVPYSMIGDEYEGIEGYVAEADLGLGCGLPVEHAGLQAGQTVLDLGSGAGLDAFVARRVVGESGHVIGVDMTAEMVAKARANATATGFSNVEFRLGEIEHLPVESGSVDVVISNCVLNLVPDKEAAFAEIYRVLKPGGHFCISDVVSSAKLPHWLKDVAEAYAGCISGTVPRDEYLHMITDAGFRSVRIAGEKRIEIPPELLKASLTAEQLAALREQELHVDSITVIANRP